MIYINPNYISFLSAVPILRAPTVARMVMAPTACVPPIDISTIKHKPDFVHPHNNSPNLLGNHGGDELSQSRLAAKKLVLDVLKKRAAEVNIDNCGPGEEDAFYVADMGEIYRQHLRWKMQLGRVKPFYGEFLRPWPRGLFC